MIVLGEKHVLLVEKTPEVVQYIQELLSDGNMSKQVYRITLADSTETAIRHLQNAPGKYDLVITCLALPDRNDGIKLCERIKNGFPEIPLLVFTGYDETDFKPSELRYMDGFIQKSAIRLSEFLNTIERMSSGQLFQTAFVDVHAKLKQGCIPSEQVLKKLFTDAMQQKRNIFRVPFARRPSSNNLNPSRRMLLWLAIMTEDRKGFEEVENIISDELQGFWEFAQKAKAVSANVQGPMISTQTTVARYVDELLECIRDAGLKQEIAKKIKTTAFSCKACQEEGPVKTKILLVEDDPCCAGIFQIMLEDEYDVTRYETAYDALRNLRYFSDEYALIISCRCLPSKKEVVPVPFRIDKKTGWKIYGVNRGITGFSFQNRKMLEMDGIQMSAEIKRLYPDVPILIVAGAADMCRDALRSGVIDGLMQKPVKCDHFIKTVKDLKESRKSI